MRVRQVVATIGFFVLATAGVARAAHATSLSTDGQWVVLDDLLTAPSDYPEDPFTFTSPVAVEFNITDLYVVGDGFSVSDSFNGGPSTVIGTFNNGFSWLNIGGACVDPFSVACHYTTDPGTAFADPDFNQGSILLAAGTHSLTIESLIVPLRASDGTPFEDATVAFNATTVPEPASLALLALGIGLAFGALRRRPARS